MRKLPYLLSALGAALTAGAAETAAPQRIIDIRTDDISLILSAAPGEEVRFLHFGGRIDDPAPLAGYRSYRHPTTTPRTWPTPPSAAATTTNRSCA